MTRQTTTKEDGCMTSDIISSITCNLDIDQVFDDDCIKSYVSASFSPENVFSEYDLSVWAEANGYVKEA